MTRMITVSEDEWDKLEAVYKAAGFFLDTLACVPEYYGATAMTELCDALDAVQTKQENLTDAQQNNLNPADSRQKFSKSDIRGTWSDDDSAEQGQKP